MASNSNNKEKETAAENAGIGVIGLQSSQAYSENVVFQANRGHGFAAEKANHKADIFSGKSAKIVGGDNAKNGADRIVNGVSIQTKYCNGGGKCISECFGDDGQFRYLRPDGNPMQIEVPADMYDAAVQSMQEKIKQGRVPGIKDPSKASEVVRKGNITYAQAKNIARFGTVEGLTYDAANGIQVAGGAASVSAAVTFALSIWRGEDKSAALEAACYSGLSVGGIAFITTIATSQIGRTGVELGLRPASDWVVGQLGPKATRWISSNLSSIHGASNLSGAAAQNHVSKLMRGNVVTAVVTTAILSTGDFVRLFQGRISGGQAFKNVASTGASVAGGIGGAALAGAALGTLVPLPVAGTVAGYIVGGIGGILGGMLSGKATSTVLDSFIEDDASKMLAIVNNVFGAMAVDYLLTEEEANGAIGQLEQINLVDELRNMYASKDRESFATTLLTPLIEDQVKRRPIVKLPSAAEFMGGIKKMVSQTMEEEARERRARLLGKIGRSIKWAAIVGFIAFIVTAIRDYQLSTSEPKDEIKQEILSTTPAITPAPVLPVTPPIEPPKSEPQISQPVQPIAPIDVSADENLINDLYGKDRSIDKATGKEIPFVFHQYKVNFNKLKYKIALIFNRRGSDVNWGVAAFAEDGAGGWKKVASKADLVYLGVGSTETQPTIVDGIQIIAQHDTEITLAVKFENKPKETNPSQQSFSLTLLRLDSVSGVASQLAPFLQPFSGRSKVTIEEKIGSDPRGYIYTDIDSVYGKRKNYYLEREREAYCGVRYKDNLSIDSDFCTDKGIDIR